MFKLSNITTSQIAKRRLRFLCLLFLFSLININYSKAQNAESYNFNASLGVFNALGGTTMSLSGGNADEGWFNGIAIGFTFNYCNVNYTHIHCSTNGWMTFGTSSTNNVLSNASSANNISSGGTRPLIAPLWDDLNLQANTNLSYTLSGTSPNRVFTVEWLNVKWSGSATGNTISFQVKLYETSNKIEFIYRPESGVVAFASASVGLSDIATGSGNFISIDGTGLDPNKSSTTETTNINIKPTSGQKYIFTPPQPIPSCILFSEDFEGLSIGNLQTTGTLWRMYEITSSVNNWYIGDNSSAITGTKSLTISNYTYNKTDDADKVAYYATKINALNFYNLKINFKWKCLGETNTDYGLLVWSIDGVNWQSVTSTKYTGQSTTQTIENLDLSVCDNKEFFIGYRWINNSSGGTNPPFTVDDILIDGTPYLQYSFSFRQDVFTPISEGIIVTLDGNGGSAVSLPFTFNYANTNYTTIRVSKNGWIKMGIIDPSNAYDNNLGNLSYTSFLAPLWDTLCFDAFSSIIYTTIGTTPNNVFCVEWRNILWGNARQNFQVKLSETTGVIEFIYGQMMEPTNATATIGINDGTYCGSRFISVTPKSTPSISLDNSNNFISTNTYLTNGLVYVFNPQAMQNYSTWQAANIVVGQPNFTTNNSTASQTIASGANSSSVSSKGILAVGSYYSNRVLLWNSIPTSNGMAANVVVGQTNFTSTTTGTTNSKLNHPYNVAFSPDGNKLLIADAGNNRILIWNTIPTTNGVPADVVIGQTNFTSSSSGYSSTKLNTPTGILVLPNGKLIITDKNNNRVLIYNSIPTSNGVAADLVIGQNDFTTNSSGSTANKFDNPWDAAFTSEGKLLISDNGNSSNGNHRILIFNVVPSVNGVSADFVIGNTVFGQKPSTTTRTGFDQPCVTVSCEGKVAIADYGNSRIMVYNRVPTSNGAPADVVLGQPDFTTKVSFNDGSNNSGSPSDKNMYFPYSICFDINGRLMVNGTNPGGSGMHRVMIYGTTPTNISDLGITLTSNATGTMCIGSFVTFTVNVTNSGPDDADHVVVNAALPVGFNMISSYTTIGSYNSLSGYWSIPAIPNGSVVTLTFVGQITSILAGNSNVTAYANILASMQNDNNFNNNGDNEILGVGSNNSPTITPIADVSISRNSNTGPIAFTISDVETPPASLTLIGTSSNTSIVQNENIVFGGSGANRTVTVTPTVDQIGIVDIIITVSDGTCTKQDTFKISCGNIWKGTINTDWHASGNWTFDVPTLTIEAIIPTHPIGPNFPVITSNESCLDLEIQTNSYVTINGDKTLTIYGYLYNNGTFNITFGTVIFNGSISQNINSGTCSFYNVEFNNTTVGSNDIVLLSNMTITNQATLRNGIVNTGVYTMIFNGDNATVNITPSPSNNSHINGKVRKIGTTAFEFPIGKGGFWAPASIAVSILSNTIDAEYFNSACDNNSAPFMNGLDHVSYVEKWEITRVEGNSYPAIVLFWKDGNRSGINDLSNLKVAHWNSATLKWDDMGGVGIGTISSGSITSSDAFTSYSPISFGTKTNSNPLPIELLSYNLFCDKVNIVIEWSTASETNNDFFTIESSPDGINFTPINIIKGAGNSNTILNYSFIDKQPYSETVFYRLKQTDYDGKYKYFEVKSIDCNGSSQVETILNIHPNPITNIVFFEISNLTENNINIQLTDMLGNIIETKVQKNISENHVTIYFNMSKYRVGVYYFKLTSGNYSKTGKIIKI